MKEKNEEIVMRERQLRPAHYLQSDDSITETKFLKKVINSSAMPSSWSAFSGTHTQFQLVQQPKN